MSFTINIYYKGNNGSAKSFAQEMISSGIVEEIRSKSGNLRYEYFEPLEDKEQYYLLIVGKIKNLLINIIIQKLWKKLLN